MGKDQRIRKLGNVIPELFPGIEGLKPLGHPGDIVPEILDESLIDSRVEVELEQAARACNDLAAGGMFVGPSSGANVHVARRARPTRARSADQRVPRGADGAFACGRSSKTYPPLPLHGPAPMMVPCTSTLQTQRLA